MAIPGTTQPVTQRSLLEYSVGKPNDFPTSTSSRAFGNPAQTQVPNLGTPSNVVLGFDQIYLTTTIPANALAALTPTTYSANVITFPGMPLPLVTGTSDQVYCIVTPSMPNISGDFIPGPQFFIVTYTIKQANGPPLQITPNYQSTGQMSGAVSSVGRAAHVPAGATVIGISVRISVSVYNRIASPAAGAITTPLSMLLIANTGYVGVI